jgi:hypothetical protein
MENGDLISPPTAMTELKHGSDGDKMALTDLP